MSLSNSISLFLPIRNSKVISIKQHGQSHYGKTAQVTVQLPSGQQVDYFAKVMQGDLAILTCKGEYEALKEINSICTHAPNPYSWGRYVENGVENAFLLVEFVKISKQPADPKPLASALANLHLESSSPTGKFGFHVATVHTRNTQAVDFWTSSWCELFTAHLSRILSHARAFAWPAFDTVGNLVLTTVVPGTAMGEDGRPYFFDVASFYAHNEYELGDWRAERHALSRREYVDAYKALVPVSEPVENWDSRNLLYSLPWNICNALFVPGSTQKLQVFEDMVVLCERVCPDEIQTLRKDWSCT
ncbi:hypothetical protein BDW62DRAFT_185892 [Aspergillus aurantiobrunneus]